MYMHLNSLFKVVQENEIAAIVQQALMTRNYVGWQKIPVGIFLRVPGMFVLCLPCPHCQNFFLVGGHVPPPAQWCHLLWLYRGPDLVQLCPVADNLLNYVIMLHILELDSAAFLKIAGRMPRSGPSRRCRPLWGAPNPKPQLTSSNVLSYLN